MMNFVEIFCIISIIFALICWVFTLIIFVKTKNDKQKENEKLFKFFDNQIKYNKLIHEQLYNLNHNLLYNGMKKE